MKVAQTETISWWSKQEYRNEAKDTCLSYKDVYLIREGVKCYLQPLSYCEAPKVLSDGLVKHFTPYPSKKFFGIKNLSQVKLTKWLWKMLIWKTEKSSSHKKLLEIKNTESWFIENKSKWKQCIRKLKCE